MYDWPEVQDRTDAFWRDVRAALATEAPDALARPEDLAKPWTDPELLLGQTCGLPFVSGRCGDARIVARASYGVEGTGEGTYSSALICRADDAREFADFRGARAAINELGSQSGCNALKDAFLQAGLADDGPLFSEAVMSGGHRTSANLIAEGKADIAAIDAVSWALHGEWEPEAHARLRVLDWTRPMPALPFITGATQAPMIPMLQSALKAASKPGAPTGIPVDIHPATAKDYEPIRELAGAVEPLALA
ncbi:MAG: PhnD/SsuA/transferrin family substrate-binding protein [Pseudomonadota bacterium]